MKQSVAEYVKKCDSCAVQKQLKMNKAPMGQFIVGEPSHCLHKVFTAADFSEILFHSDRFLSSNPINISDISWSSSCSLRIVCP
jgi:hypothetical protein